MRKIVSICLFVGISSSVLGALSGELQENRTVTRLTNAATQVVTAVVREPGTIVLQMCGNIGGNQGMEINRVRYQKACGARVEGFLMNKIVFQKIQNGRVVATRHVDARYVQTISRDRRTTQYRYVSDAHILERGGVAANAIPVFQLRFTQRN